MLPKKYPVTCHTKNIGSNSTFVAIKGFSLDGNKFIKKAIKRGAAKIISDQEDLEIIKFCKKQKIQFELVENARIALAKESSKTLKTKNIKTKIIGITGTKGKTTTTYIIEHILSYSGFKTALIGTIKNKILNKEIKSINTTPESDFLHMFLHECDKQNINFVVMEVSSHALSLNRTYGIKFDAIGFTNLANEHLDFYKNMDKYFKAKSKIFNQIKKDSVVVINKDDQWGKRAIEEQKNINNLITLEEKNFNIIKKYIPNHMPGKFNLYNFFMSFLICKKLGISEEKILKAIKNFPGVPGRLQKHVLKNGTIAFIDYAHNPSSMKEVLKTLKPLTKNLIVVFGCGGNRDKTKRPMMGDIAIEYADKVIITNDNPRFENPREIINDIIKKIPKNKMNKIEIIEDRERAIKKAVSISDKNSIIAILGKGHENYNLIKNKKYFFDDFAQIKKY
ncbi:UDP-N-acetylmuramoyl-L-alanyl-D-glutamate--2,6-diaminopimelate ligase [Candidatus Dependentiae bacterium]|nr:UDP-N-acetylmuramoyl-L-alanyl-D-glutamate--2,6-diaminopimelate ligase [Candidatus Dependentiae bacterium]